MAASREKTRAIDGLQGVCALIGITVGVIPLVSWAVGGESGGLLGRISGWSPLGSQAYVLPVAVIAVASGVIAILEVMKRAWHGHAPIPTGLPKPLAPAHACVFEP